MMDKIYRIFYKTILLLSVVLLGTVLIGTVLCFDNVSSHSLLYILWGMVLSFQLIVFYLCFNRFNTGLGEKGQRIISFSLFSVMLIIFAVLFFNLSPRPFTDSFDDLDTSYYLMRYGTVTPGNIHAPEIGIFGNNYFFILVFFYYYKILSLFNISGFLAASRVLSILAMITAALFSYLSVKTIRGIKAANKVLFLTVINPLFYPLGFWIYTLSFSLAFMMISFYLMICLYKSEDKRHSALLGGLLGIMTVFCYEMRPTALFIFIAALIFLPFVFKNKDLKYKTLAGIIFLLAACLTEAFIFYKKYRVFALISDNNFPVLYWLYMGSYGDGGISTNGEVFNTMLGILHNSDRNSILMQDIIGNYREMGIAGTISLWIRKTVTTWSDGYSDIGLRLGGGTPGSSIYEFLAGDHRELFYICCNAYRAAAVLGVLYSLKKDLISKRISSYRAVLTITLFGGLFFYMFWEAKSIYSASFLPVITILASEGFCDLERDTAKQKKPLQKAHVPLSVLLLAFSCFMFISLAGNCREFKDMRIDSSNTNHEMSVIPWSGNGELTQTFTTEGSFNRIEIPVSHVWPPETVSSYTISISEAETGKELFDRVVTVPDNGSDDMITLSPGIIGKGSYILTVRKDDSSMTDIDLYTKEAYYFDSYEGELSYDGKTPVGDLTMNISYCNTEKYLDIPAAVILLLIYIGASALPVIYRR